MPYFLVILCVCQVVKSIKHDSFSSETQTSSQHSSTNSNCTNIYTKILMLDTFISATQCRSPFIDESLHKITLKADV